MQIVLNNGQIVDGQGAVFHGHVVVEGERIVAVGPGDAPPSAARRIDLRGRTVLPGAFQSHTQSVRRAHAAGVTVAMGTDAGATIFRRL